MSFCIDLDGDVIALKQPVTPLCIDLDSDVAALKWTVMSLCIDLDSDDTALKQTPLFTNLLIMMGKVKYPAVVLLYVSGPLL